MPSCYCHEASPIVVKALEQKVRLQAVAWVANYFFSHAKKCIVTFADGNLETRSAYLRRSSNWTNHACHHIQT